MWQIMGASVQGTSHLRNNTPCQDSHHYKSLPTCAIVAVSDGLGSARLSQDGSRTAVSAVIRVLEGYLKTNIPNTDSEWKAVVSKAFEEARTSLKVIADTFNEPLYEFGCTLLVVVVTETMIVVGQIGDGAVVVSYQDESLETISKPQNVDYVNSTIPLTTQDALNLVQYRCISKQVKAVAVFSDGLQNMALNYATSKPFVPFFIPLFEAICQPSLDCKDASHQLENFLGSERVNERTDDDKTLVVIGYTLEKDSFA